MRLWVFGVAALLLSGNVALAQSCDPSAAEKEVADRFGPKIAAAQGVCQTANVQIEMLEFAKEAYSACLRGQSLADVLSELDRVIAQAEQAKQDAGGC